MKSQVRNQLAEIRKRRGIAASDLAQRIGVRRQTVYAIEAGTYVPNTEVALRLAQALEVSVDALFSLEESAVESAGAIASDVLSVRELAEGQAVRICQIGNRWVSVPVTATPYYLPEADGVIAVKARKGRKAALKLFSQEETEGKRLVLAGCDPAAGLLSQTVEKLGGIEVIPAAASSRQALAWLKDGRVHIAGSHLEDPKSGEFNLPFLRKEFPDSDFNVITFAHWEQGLVVAPGNPKEIRGIDDLGRKSTRLINRETGSGTRALLDRLLKNAAMDSTDISGYDRVAYGHLAAAYQVLSGQADVCIATRSAAQTFALDFIPLHSERYDLVLRKRTAELPAVRTFLDVLQRATLRRKLEVLAGYDTAQTGARMV